MQQRDRRPASSAAVIPPVTDDKASAGFDLDAFLGAGSSLPHGEAIQRSFGRHDVSGIAATVGGPAATSSAAMGASAYAVGNRVAFAESPDLRLAAHEAAHVVQQRAGVQLQSNTGVSGDRYEQHADRVADLVVRGESAERELDQHAGGGSTMAIQRFDSPGHIEVGESVKGDDIIIYDDIAFTSGEIAALTDYIGTIGSPASVERRFSKPQVTEMKRLLVAGIEDTYLWDKATNGAYSAEAQANATHFAPSAGDGGANFRSTFIELYSRALHATTSPPVGGTIGRVIHGDDDPLTMCYSAEHYLQDAFSAGHQVASHDI
ncbi:MAG: DUF4157 domain-containing protein, partial [Kofleriaceae bacterium]